MMKPTAGMQSEAAFQGIQPLHIIANLKSDGDKNGSVLVVKIRCNSMDLAGDIIQDMANYFKFTDLESEADFPDEMQRFEEVVNRVADCNDARLRLAADMADDSQRVKALVIRAEDSRLMNDMDGMRRAYTELFTLNNQLVVGYNVRASNHEALLAALKEVNLMIQKAASLRVGKPKTTVISDCRAAVKANNMSALYRIIKTGYDNGP
jgi:Bardet-Biedl syndrome 2 protein